MSWGSPHAPVRRAASPETIANVQRLRREHELAVGVVRRAQIDEQVAWDKFRKAEDAEWRERIGVD